MARQPDRRGVVSDIPRFKAVSGEDAERLLGSWLQRPDLMIATIVSFAFDPRLALSTGPAGTGERGGLFLMLDRVASTVNLTFVSGDPGVEPGPRAEVAARALQRLSQAGASVYVNERLHAKVFLFEAGGRACWMVGSSNLSMSGLRQNEEVNLRGFHPDDYREVHAHVQRIIEESRPI